MFTFQTESGTTYQLKTVKMSERPYRGQIRRLGNKPFRNHSPFIPLDMNDGEWGMVHFTEWPSIGSSFTYFHDRWGACTSTPVIAVHNEGGNE